MEGLRKPANADGVVPGLLAPGSSQATLEHRPEEPLQMVLFR